MHSQARVHCAQAERSIVRPAETICRAEPISATQLASEVEAAYMESMNEVSTQVLQAMLGNDKLSASVLVAEIQDTRQLLEGEGDTTSSRFLKVLQGMLNHTLLKEADALEGVHAAAFNRICNQVAGSDWKLVEEGKSAEVEDQGPQFSTWEDVVNGKKRQASPSASAPAEAQDDQMYRRLGLQRSATQAEVKSAYRKRALKLHPDVNDAQDANERFAELGAAYDILSDESSRALYDKYGLEGMGRHRGADRGTGNASKAWDEFKPHVRDNKHTRARGASAEAASAGSQAPAADLLPQVGAVVEYPLREMDCTPTRTRGVGLLVGRNMDRGDAGRLPEDQLDLCEVEPLQQEEPESDRWVVDQLGYPAFARLIDLHVLLTSDYDRRHDVWVLAGELSPYCSGPELPEEVIL